MRRARRRRTARTTIPSGSVTLAVRSGGVLIATSLPFCAYRSLAVVTVSSFCGTARSTSTPVGVLGVLASGCTWIVGANWKRESPQPVICMLAPDWNGVNAPG